MIILNCRVIRTSNFPQTVFEELEVTEKLVHYYFTILLKFLKSIFGLRQGAKEPEMPRTAAINTNLEDLGEEMIKDILVGGNGSGVDSAEGDQVSELFCEISTISFRNFVGKNCTK
jgi:hypothetical protein